MGPKPLYPYVAPVFTDPLYAFVAAWEHKNFVEDGKKKDEEGVLRTIRREDALQGMWIIPEQNAYGQSYCSSHRHSTGAMMSIYFETLNDLIDKWRLWKPLGIEPLTDSTPEWLDTGSQAVIWSGAKEHTEVFAKVQKAVLDRVWYLGQRPDPRPGAIGSVVTNHLVFKMCCRFNGKFSETKSPKTAAYALFGDFLASDTDAIGFCAKCGKAFEVTKKRIKYCSDTCGSADTSRSSRCATQQMYRERVFQKLSTALEEWHSKKSKNTSDWRKFIETKAKLITIDGRHHRELSHYIKAASTPPGSTARQRLLEMVFSSEPSKQHRSRMDHFLENINKAQLLTGAHQ